jgi:alpha-galactosidase
MMIEIQSPFLSLEIEPISGVWSVVPAAEGATALQGARIGIAFRVGRKRSRSDLRDFQAAFPVKPAKDPLLGRLRNLSLAADAGEGLAVRVEWRVSLEKPFLLWRVILENRGAAARTVDWIDVCRAGGRFGWPGGVELPTAPAERALFVNGWQSWSFAGGRRSGDRQPSPMLGPYNLPMHVGTSLRSSGRPGHFVSDMFTVIGRAGGGGDDLVAGFLSQHEQFGAVETWLPDGTLSLRMRADCDGVRLDTGARLATDWAYLAPGPKASAADYFDAAGRVNGARNRRAAPEGWCSWYYYHTAIRQTELEKNTAAARALRGKLPLRMIQLDDGYAADVGDWFQRSEKFPLPMPEISARIRKAGFTPGVWISPFIVRPGSRMQREHREWLAGGVQGVMSNVKITWLRDTLALDVTRPEVADYLRELVRTAVKDWKFPFLKLDYLYIAAAKHVRFSDPTVTRAQALHRALQIIRQAAGEQTYLLGCGCPLGSGIGIFDAMRIGPDVDPFWKPHVFRRTWAARGDPTVPAAWNSVRNMLSRAPLHRRWWWNDPDCLLARDAETDLTPDERQTLASAIALSGGMLMLSDNLAALSPGSVRLAQSLFPPVYRAAAFPDWRAEAPPRLGILPMLNATGNWQVIGLFNWTDHPVRGPVDLREYLPVADGATALSFWDGRLMETRGGILEPLDIPAHGSILLAVRPRGGSPQYIGSDLHFSQGAEVAEWKTAPRSLRAVLRLGREAEGTIWLALPGKPENAVLDGMPIRPENVAQNIWKFPVRFVNEGLLEIKWKRPDRVLKKAVE